MLIYLKTSIVSLTNRDRTLYFELYGNILSIHLLSFKGVRTLGGTCTIFKKNVKYWDYCPMPQAFQKENVNRAEVFLDHLQAFIRQNIDLMSHFDWLIGKSQSKTACNAISSSHPGFTYLGAILHMCESIYVCVEAFRICMYMNVAVKHFFMGMCSIRIAQRVNKNVHSRIRLFVSTYFSFFFFVELTCDLYDFDQARQSIELLKTNTFWEETSAC